MLFNICRCWIYGTNLYLAGTQSKTSWWMSISGTRMVMFTETSGVIHRVTNFSFTYVGIMFLVVGSMVPIFTLLVHSQRLHDGCQPVVQGRQCGQTHLQSLVELLIFHCFNGAGSGSVVQIFTSLVLSKTS